MNAVAFVSVSVAIPALAFASRRLARAIAPEMDSAERAGVALCLAVAGFLAVTGLVGRAFHHVDAGLVACALAACAAALFLRRSRAGDDAPPAEKAPLRLRLATGAIAVLYVRLGWMYQMHDEHSLFGHKSMVEMIRWGDYPPYLPPMPSYDARYHYGFDLLAGALARAYGLSSDVSIDLAMVLLVIAISLAAAALATSAGAKGSAAFSTIAIHLGAGLSFLMLAGVEGRHPRCLIQYHHPTCDAELYPTPILNIFQHPVSAGVPLFLVMLVLAKKTLDPDRGRRFAAPIALVVLLPALALGQAIYFALGAIAAVSSLPFWFAARDRLNLATFRRALVLIAAIGLGSGLAYLAGGMFTPFDAVDPTALYRKPELGYPANVPLTRMLRHHALNLGLPFVLLPLIGIAALIRRRFELLALVAFALGGIAVPHLYDYRYSWDIVKFPSAAAFALIMLYVIVFDGPLALRPTPLAWLRRGGRALLLGSGALAATWLLVPLDPSHQLYDTGRFVNDPLVEQTIRWFRAQGEGRRGMIFAQSNVAQLLAVFGGLPVASSDYDYETQGIKREILGRHRSLEDRIRATMDAKALEERGVRYVMFSNEELNNLGERARQALESGDGGRIEMVAEFPGTEPIKTRRIWRVARPDERGTRTSTRSAYQRPWMFAMNRYG